VDEDTGAVRVSDGPADEETRRLLHGTIAAVREDMADLGFNTAVAKLITLNNRLTQVAAAGATPREVVEPLLLMLAPLAPHVAEELWSRLGHAASLTYEDYPVADERWLVVDEVEIPVQVNGKVRARIRVPVGADQAAVEESARDAVSAQLDGATVRKVVYVPGRLVNFVVG
jgi:leucyl-tRNA synthetase